MSRLPANLILPGLQTDLRYYLDTTYGLHTGVCLNSNTIDNKRSVLLDVPTVDKKLLNYEAAMLPMVARANAYLTITAPHRATSAWAESSASPHKVLKAPKIVILSKKLPAKKHDNFSPAIIPFSYDHNATGFPFFRHITKVLFELLLGNGISDAEILQRFLLLEIESEFLLFRGQGRIVFDTSQVQICV